MRKLHEFFKVLQSQKKNNCCGNYMRKYGSLNSTKCHQNKTKWLDQTATQQKIICLWGCPEVHAALKKQDLPSILLFLAVACFLPLLSLLPLSTCWVGRVEEFIVPKSEFLKHFVESHQKIIFLPNIYYQSWPFSSKLHNCSHTTQKVIAVL